MGRRPHALMTTPEFDLKWLIDASVRLFSSEECRLVDNGMVTHARQQIHWLHSNPLRFAVSIRTDYPKSEPRIRSLINDYVWIDRALAGISEYALIGRFRGLIDRLPRFCACHGIRRCADQGE